MNSETTTNSSHKSRPKVSYRKTRPAPPPPPPLNTVAPDNDSKNMVSSAQPTQRLTTITDSHSSSQPVNTSSDARILQRTDASSEAAIAKSTGNPNSPGSSRNVSATKQKKSIKGKMVVKPCMPPPAPPVTDSTVKHSTPTNSEADNAPEHTTFTGTESTVKHGTSTDTKTDILSEDVKKDTKENVPFQSSDEAFGNSNVECHKTQAEQYHHQNLPSESEHLSQKIAQQNVKRKKPEKNMHEPLRKKYSLPLCCGLGSKRTDSPYEIELPNRTECALPQPKPVSDLTDMVVLPGGEGQSRCIINASSGRSLDTHSNIDGGEESGTEEKPTIHNVKLLKPGHSPMASRLKYSSSCVIQSKSNKYGSELKVVDNDAFVQASDQNGSQAKLENSKKSIPKRSSNIPQQTTNLRKRYSRSTEDLNFMMVDLDLDLATHLEKNRSFRSSFIGEDASSKPPVFQATGDFQTLLKHSRTDDENLYVLPQPYCHGENTLKAVKRITEKYDTLERWKLKASVFSQNTLKNSSCMKQMGPGYTQNMRGENSDKSPGSNKIVEESQDETNTVSTDPGPLVNKELNTASAPSIILSKQEIQQIEMFYKSRDTEITVCSCTADLLFGTDNKQGDIKWEQSYTGVPAFLLNCGNTRRPRQLNVVFSDRYTSFMLWNDKVNYLSQYTDHSPLFHTMHLSTYHNRLAAFKFHCPMAAAAFLDKYKQLTADCDDTLWKVSQSHKTSQRKNNSKSCKPVKGNISQPFNFSHINYVDSSRIKQHQNFVDFMPAKCQEKENSEIRQRAYSG